MSRISSMLAVGVCVAFAPLRVYAQSPDSTTKPKEGAQSADIKTSYDNGVRLLKSGKNLERAIDLLASAVRNDPGNLDYQLALGSAYASRFASVAVAWKQQQKYEYDKQQYDERAGKWQKAQLDPNDPAYNAPPPVAPLPPLTPDDNREYRSVTQETIRQLRDLGLKAVAAFEQARDLEKVSEPAKSGAAEYTRGWGLFVLRRYGKEVITDKRPVNPRDAGPQAATAQALTVRSDSAQDVPKAIPGAAPELSVTQEDITACFKRCVEMDSASPNNWHSLGLSKVPQLLYPVGFGGTTHFGDDAPIAPKGDIESARTSLERALSMKPNNFDLLYQLALVTQADDPTKAVAYLERATRHSASNAVLWYVLAAARFREAKNVEPNIKPKGVKSALGAVQRGNMAPDLAVVQMNAPVAVLVRKAWSFRTLGAFADDYWVLQSLSQSLLECISDREDQHDTEGLLWSIQLLMDMGLRQIASFEVDDFVLRDSWTVGQNRGRLVIGLANGFRAYSAIKKSQQAEPDARKARLLAEYQDLVRMRLTPLEQRFAVSR